MKLWKADVSYYFFSIFTAIFFVVETDSSTGNGEGRPISINREKFSRMLFIVRLKVVVHALARRIVEC